VLQILRIVVQTAFFLLFLFLMFQTRFPGEDYIGNVEAFFHWDPLLALTTFLASKTLFLAFKISAVIVLLTFVMGRVACGWACPMGSLQQFFSFLFKKTKLLRAKMATDRLPTLKYYILFFVIVSSLFTLNLVGWLDPFSFLTRSFSIGVVPVFSYVFSAFIGGLYTLNLFTLGDGLFQFFETLDMNAVFVQGFFILLLFTGVIFLNAFRERFWCRTLCPLGAFLGIIARWNILKIKVNSNKCIECNLCNIHCQTQANPFPEKDIKSSECIYCFTCGAVCPTSAIDFDFKARPETIGSVDLSRRKVLLSTFLGIVAIPFFRINPLAQRTSEKLIRPPGALPEARFLRKCVKCGECMKVCPTNALQPVSKEAGPEGLWTPILIPKIGYCEYYCSLCSQVCPTGAIQELTVEAKTQVTIGTAWINKNRCIPWVFGDPCIVCEEHCPVSPKAIKMVDAEVLLPDGTFKRPRAPFIETELCIGCGICENKCPVVDSPAIYVTSIGEDRSEKNQFLLDILSENELF